MLFYNGFPFCKFLTGLILTSIALINIKVKVGKGGLEPPPLTRAVPKTGAATNYATCPSIFNATLFFLDKHNTFPLYISLRIIKLSFLQSERV